MTEFKYVCKAKYNIKVDNPIINGQLYHYNAFDADLNVCVGIDTTKEIPIYGVRLSLFDNNELTNIGYTQYTCTFKRLNWIAEEIEEFLNTHCFTDGNFSYACLLHLESFFYDNGMTALHIGHNYIGKYTFGIKIKTLYNDETLRYDNKIYTF